MQFWVTSNKIRCISCYWSPSSSWAVDPYQQKHLLLMPGGYSGKFSWRQCKIQLPRDNLGEQNVLEKAFFWLSVSLKSKILATRVPPPGYTGFITNLLFWATQRLENMYLSMQLWIFKKFQNLKIWLTLESSGHKNSVANFRTLG